MNIIKINPCRPFTGMHNPEVYPDILKNALIKAYDLNQESSLLLDEAVHTVYSENASPVMGDIVDEVFALQKHGHGLCFQLGGLLRRMVDRIYPESKIFCDRDGIALNELDAAGFHFLLLGISDARVQAFMERMILSAIYYN